MNVLVTGGTGKTGRHVVEQLTGKDVAVTVATRSRAPHGSGVRHVVFDWTDRRTWQPALAETDAVYVVAPAFVADPEPVVTPFLELAAGRRVVMLSAYGTADLAASGLGRLAHRVLANGGAVLEPSWFLQNLSEGLFLSTLQQGFLAMAAGDGRVPFVDTRDVAAVAVAALEGGADGRLHITGPDALTHAELVAQVSAAAGRDITYVDLTPEQMHAGLVQAGVPADYAAGLLALCADIRAGAAAAVSEVVREVTGRAPRTVADFVAEHAGLWKA